MGENEVVIGLPQGFGLGFLIILFILVFLVANAFYMYYEYEPVKTVTSKNKLLYNFSIAQIALSIGGLIAILLSTFLYFIRRLLMGLIAYFLIFSGALNLIGYVNTGDKYYFFAMVFCIIAGFLIFSFSEK